MKNILLMIALLFGAVTAQAQVSSHTAFRFIQGITKPAVCAVGDVWTDTSTSPAVNYNCLTLNTWTALGGGGAGTITAGTTNFIPKYTAATTIGNSLLDDGATTANTLTYTGTAGAKFVLVATGTSPPAVTAGTAGGVAGTEGTAFTNVAGAAGFYFDATSHEIQAKTNGASGAGMMVRAQPSAINQTAKTASIGTATLCAASAGACNIAGQYHVHLNFWGSGTACSSVTAGSVNFALTWTDENAVAHSAVIVPVLSQTSATALAQGNTFLFQTALANESASGDITISTNGSVIQYATTYTACTTGTGTYNLRATVTRMQ